MEYILPSLRRASGVYARHFARVEAVQSNVMLVSDIISAGFRVSRLTLLPNAMLSRMTSGGSLI